MHEDIMPQSLEAEREVLSAIMVDPNCFEDVISTGLEAGDFYLSKHSLVYSAMRDVYATEGTVDEVIMTQVLRDRKQWSEMGGPQTLGDILDRAGTTQNVVRYCNIVKEKSGKRHMIAAGHEVTRLGHTDLPIEEALDRAEGTIKGLQKKGQVTDGCDALSGITDHMQRVSAVQRGEYNPITVPTGIQKLDDALSGGFKMGWNVAVMSCAGHGKSALAINNFALSAAKAGHPVLICSYEMSQSEVYARLLAAASGIPAHVHDKPGLTDSEIYTLNSAANIISPLPIRVVGTEARTVERIRRVARKMAMEHGRIGMVVVDYLQLMAQTKRRNSGTQEEEISHNTRSLKLLAQELDCVVVSLSQPILEAKRAKKRPHISDAKGSGAIEDDADLALVPWLPHRVREGAPKSDAEIGMDKFRHGPPMGLTIDDVRWDGSRMCFGNVIPSFAGGDE